MSDQNTPQSFDQDLSVEELERVAGGAEEEEGVNTGCTEINVYQCGKQGT